MPGSGGVEMKFIFYLFGVPAFIIIMLFYNLYYNAKEKREREQMQRRKEEAERQRAEATRLKRQREEAKEAERKKNLAVFRETVFPLSCCKDFEIQKIWSNWESASQNIHDTDAALIEQGKAVFDVDVLLVDKGRALGVFNGKYQSIPYEATLSKCSCPYFKVYKTPCCHMYRLF